MAQSAGFPPDHSCRCFSEIRPIRLAALDAGQFPAAPRTRHPSSDEGCRVQPSSRDKFLVPASVVIVGCVERLMQITDKVQKELERQELLGGAGGRIAELDRELIDLVHDASSWRPFGGRDPGRERRMAEAR